LLEKRNRLEIGKKEKKGGKKIKNFFIKTWQASINTERSSTGVIWQQKP